MKAQDALSAGAAEFVPGRFLAEGSEGRLSSQASEFVPCFGTSHQQNGGRSQHYNWRDQDYSWQATGGKYSGPPGFDYYAGWQSQDNSRITQGSGLRQNMGSQGFPQPISYFNPDAYSTDSSSVSGSDSDDEFETGKSFPTASASRPPASASGGSTVSTASTSQLPASASGGNTASTASTSQQPASNIEGKSVSSTREPVVGNGQVNGFTHEGGEMASDDSQFCSPLLASSGRPSALSSTASSPQAHFRPRPLGTPGSQAADEPPLLRLMSDDKSECDSDWSGLPDLVTSIDQEGGSSSSMIAEISERTMKQWLKRFTNDSETEHFCCQFRFWILSNASAAGEVASFLLRSGLEDCRIAEVVEKAFLALLRPPRGQLKKEMVEKALSEWGDEELEDMALDNPKVRDFVAAVHQLLSGDFSEFSSTADINFSDSMVLPSMGVNVYTLELMLAVRHAVSQAEGDELKTHGLRTEAASKFQTSAPTPVFATPKTSWRSTASRHEPKKSGRSKESKDLKARLDAPKLEVSDFSWQAHVSKRKGKTPTASDDDGFVSSMRLALNKLTVEKFDSLSAQIIHLVSQSQRPNRGIPLLMQLVFEKATTQHHFINMYVNLCKKLHEWLIHNDQNAETESQSNFKRILLNQCQSSFEQYLEPPEGFHGLEGDELYEAEVKYKTRMLGNIRLVGELIRHGMLAPKIAIAVAMELASDDPSARNERLETLAVFLETVGLDLDDAGWKHHSEFNAVFQKVSLAIKDPTISTRVKCLLQDVLDLRISGWKSVRRKDVDKKGPATIAEVHQQASAVQLSTPSKTSNKGQRPKREAPAVSFFGSTPSSGSSISRPSSKATPQASQQLTRLPSRQLSESSDILSPPPGFAKSTAPTASPPTETQSSVSRDELLANFHREVALTLRRLGESIDVAAAAHHLANFRPPAESSLEELVDLIARMVDEPRMRRQQLFPLLSALVAASVFQPPGVLAQAIETFACDVFADPAAVDPPDLGDIVLRELLPALGFAPGSLNLPPHLAGLAALARFAGNVDGSENQGCFWQS